MNDRMASARYAWIYLLAGLLAISASIFLAYRGLRNLREEAARQNLRVEASIISALLHTRDDNIRGKPEERLLTLPGTVSSRRWITIFNSMGQERWSSLRPGPALTEKNSKAIHKALKGESAFSWFRHQPDGTRFYGLVEPITINGRITGVLCLAMNESGIGPSMDEFALLLSWFLVFVILSGLLAVRLMHLRYHRESEKMAEILADISAEDLPTGAWQAAVKLKRIKLTALSRLQKAMVSQLKMCSHRLKDCLNELEKLALLFRNMKEAVFLLDDHKKIMTMNRAASQLANVPAEKASGRPFNLLFRDMELKNFMDKVYFKRTAQESEITVYTGTGGLEKRFFLIKAVILTEEHEKRLCGVLVVMDDVTRLKKLEDTRRRFVANVSHELKTPVTVIRGYAETLRDGVDDPEIEGKFLDIIQRQAHRLEDLVEDILCLSKMEAEAQRPPLRLSKTSLQVLIAGAVETCRLRAQEKGITIEIRCHAPQMKIAMDISLMEQAITNLVINAINYSSEGQVVTIETWERDHMLGIEVKDHGIGIAKTEIEHIFQRFYRVDKARSRQLGGTGLGLAIVKHIVQAHQGQVKVESEPGTGSTFTILLPVNS